MVFAHNEPIKINEMYDDVYSKKAFQHRDTKEALIQSWKSEDGRNIMDLILAVMDKSNPPEFRGVVRLALYVNN